jgi:hypothetical protein
MAIFSALQSQGTVGLSLMVEGPTIIFSGIGPRDFCHQLCAYVLLNCLFLTGAAYDNKKMKTTPVIILIPFLFAFAFGEIGMYIYVNLILFYA